MCWFFLGWVVTLVMESQNSLEVIDLTILVIIIC